MSLRRLLAAAIVLLSLCVISCASLLRTGSWEQAQDAYNQGDYRTAIQETDKFLAWGTPPFEDRARANLFKARCHEKLGETAEAIALFAYVTKNFPETSYDYEARAGLARILPTEPVKAQESY